MNLNSPASETSLHCALCYKSDHLIVSIIKKELVGLGALGDLDEHLVANMPRVKVSQDRQI